MSQNRRVCVNNPDLFCYICGKYTHPETRRNMTERVKQVYEKYFGCKVGDQDKIWAPHFCCRTCSSALTKWYNGTISKLPFAVPMIQRNQHPRIS